MNCGNNNFAQQPVEEDCEDCVQVVKTHKNVTIPCTRNTYRQYTVKVPRTVQEKVPRQVNWTDYVDQTRQVPYVENVPEERVRMESRSYSVPVQKTVTRMVNVTRKVPKTIMVDVNVQVPKQETTTVHECRTKQVPVKHMVNVPVTKYRTETYKKPVQRTKTEWDTISKIQYDTEVRTACVPVTKNVIKRVPVYNLVARPAAPCPAGMDCGQEEVMSAAAQAAIGPYAGSVAGGYAPSAAGGYAPSVVGSQMGAPMGGAPMGGQMAAAGGQMAARGAAMGGQMAAAGGQMAARGAAMGGQMAASTQMAAAGGQMGARGAQMAAGGAAMGGQMAGRGAAQMGGAQRGYAPQPQGGAGRGQAYRSEFNSLDKNGDGRIDFNEYRAARQGAGAGGAAAGGAGYNAGAASGGASAVAGGCNQPCGNKQ